MCAHACVHPRARLIVCRHAKAHEITVFNLHSLSQVTLQDWSFIMYRTQDAVHWWTWPFHYAMVRPHQHILFLLVLLHPPIFCLLSRSFFLTPSYFATSLAVRCVTFSARTQQVGKRKSIASNKRSTMKRFLCETSSPPAMLGFISICHSAVSMHLSLNSSNLTATSQ